LQRALIARCHVNPALFEELRATRAPQLMPLTVSQFHEMIRTGILPDASSIELIEGLLICKDRSAAGDDLMVHDPRHALLVTRLLELLIGWAKSIGCHVRVQLPVTLTSASEPEPDLALVRGANDAFAKSHPAPGDLAAVFEVADSSLQFDRTAKTRLYAAAGIPIYWIINLRESSIEVFMRPDPTTGTYSERIEYRPGQRISLYVNQHVLDVDVAGVLA